MKMAQPTTPNLFDHIWEKVGPTTFLSKKEFAESIKDWCITPRYIDGELIGATLDFGAEFHFVTFGKRKPLSAALITECLQPIITRCGYVLTRTPKEDMRQRRFNELIGFSVHDEDEHYVNFIMNRINFHRGQECRS